MTDKPFAGRIACVTGASRGIGRATALALAAGGAQVVAVARTQGGLESLDDAIRQAGDRPILIAPGCTYDPARVPAANLEAVCRAARQ